MAATLVVHRATAGGGAPTPILLVTRKTLAEAAGGTAAAAGMVATLGTPHRLAMVLVEHRFLVLSAISLWVAAPARARAMMVPPIPQTPIPPGSTAAARPEEES